MALIICPECGHQVSNMAEACPNCGIKIAGNPAVQGAQPVAQPTPQPVNVQPAQQPVQQNAPQPTTGQPGPQPAGGSVPPYGGTPLYGEQPKKNKSLILLVSFIIALVVCVTCLFMWNSATDERAEEQRYEEVMLSTNVQDLKDYLTQFTDAPQEHRDSVNARLNMLEQEETDWSNTAASGSRNALLDFIKTHPNSLHKGEAENMVDSLDYSVAQRKNTSDAYAEYLKQHPDGKYAMEAQDHLDSKKATEVSEGDVSMARDVCRRFFQAINSKNESKLLGTVSDVMTSFLGKNNADADIAVQFMKKLYKEDITNMNWHILSDFKVEKVETDGDTPNLKAQFSAEQEIERTDASKEKYAKYVVTTEINSDGHIVKFNMKKVN